MSTLKNLSVGKQNKVVHYRFWASVWLLSSYTFSFRFVSGKPRGFCFVTYTTPASASQAIKQLNGYKLKSKHLIVRLANRGRSTATQPVVGSGSHTRRHEDKIAELEAKLLSMQNQQTVDVKTKLTQSIAPPSLLRMQTRAANTTAESEQQQQQRCNSVDSKHKHRSKPYDRGWCNTAYWYLTDREISVISISVFHSPKNSANRKI